MVGVVVMDEIITNETTDKIMDEASGQVWMPPVISYFGDFVTTNRGSISLYKCERCSAVVDDYQEHVDYHKKLQNLKNAPILSYVPKTK
jgi:hypothetical protein